MTSVIASTDGETAETSGTFQLAVSKAVELNSDFVTIGRSTTTLDSTLVDTKMLTQQKVLMT